MSDETERLLTPRERAILERYPDARGDDANTPQKRPSSERDDEVGVRPSRLVTWPLAGFLFGLVVLPISNATSVSDLLMVSLLAGIMLAVGGLIAAAIANAWRPRTKTVLPFYNATPGENWAFVLSFGLALILRSLGIHGGVFPIILASISFTVVMGGVGRFRGSVNK